VCVCKGKEHKNSEFLRYVKTRKPSVGRRAVRFVRLTLKVVMQNDDIADVILLHT